jgi:hypothetical protein
VFKVNIIKVNSHKRVVFLVHIKVKNEPDAADVQQAGVAIGRDDLDVAVERATSNALNRILGRFTFTE